MRYPGFILLFITIIFFSKDLSARVIYGVYVSNNQIEKAAKEHILEELKTLPIVNPELPFEYAVETRRDFSDKNIEFLIAVFFIGFIGVFRNLNPLYFRNLFKVFRSSTSTKRQFKEQLQQDHPANLALNIFFCLSAATYIYLVLNYLGSLKQFESYPKGYVLGALFLALVSIYLLRVLSLKIAGWLFDIEELMDNFAFQILFLNKILGLILVPFSLVLAFGQGDWVQVTLFLSFVLVFLFFFYRYARSIVNFSHFLKISKFHFFMYLCASEILPVAILIKTISLWTYLN